MDIFYSLFLVSTDSCKASAKLTSLFVSAAGSPFFWPLALGVCAHAFDFWGRCPDSGVIRVPGSFTLIICPDILPFFFT